MSGIIENMRASEILIRKEFGISSNKQIKELDDFYVSVKKLEEMEYKLVDNLQSLLFNYKTGYTLVEVDDLPSYITIGLTNKGKFKIYNIVDGEIKQTITIEMWSELFVNNISVMINDDMINCNRYRMLDYNSFDEMCASLEQDIKNVFIGQFDYIYIEDDAQS